MKVTFLKALFASFVNFMRESGGISALDDIFGFELVRTVSILLYAPDQYEIKVGSPMA
jgi:hypothetical protein